MRVRPRSSLKKAWLLSAPSTVLLLSKPEMPRKLTRPKPPSGTAPGVERANVDQRRPLMGKFSMVVWFMLVVKSARSVVIIGSSAVATTTSAIALTLSCASIVDWALALGPARKVASSTAKNATIENRHPLLFIESLPKIFGQNTPSSAHRAKRRGHQRGLRGHPPHANRPATVQRV